MTEQTERAEKLRRGKLLLKLRSKLIAVKLHDEGDRVYLRSTNDADTLKEIISEIDDYGWQEFVKEKKEPDIFETCRTAVAEGEKLRKALTESLKLQAHYAALLNDYDGGQRMTFHDADAWLARLDELAVRALLA